MRSSPLGLVIFEVPTGVIADIRGRRFSYLLGTLTLAVSTLLLPPDVAHVRAVLGVGARRRCVWGSASRSSRARFKPGSSMR